MNTGARLPRRPSIAAAALPAVLCLVLGGGAGASPWNRPAGEGLVIFDYTLGAGTDYFDGRGRLAPARLYRKGEVAAYVEYGATDTLTLLVTGKNRWQWPGLCGNWRDWPIRRGRERHSERDRRITTLPGGKIRWQKPQGSLPRESGVEDASKALRSVKCSSSIAASEKVGEV